MSSTQRKPDTSSAMRALLARIRSEIPLDLDAASFCSDDCKACSFKLLEYLRAEVEGWEARLDAGDQPNFGDLNQLGRSAQRIHRVLARNGQL